MPCLSSQCLYLSLCSSDIAFLYSIDHVPYVECGDYVTFNNEKGGVMESLKEDNIVDLDSKLQSNVIPEWLSTKAMICSWLTVAAQYELWMASDGSVADKIYFSDLSWPIRKALHWKQTQAMKKILGTTTLTAADKEEEVFLSLSHTLARAHTHTQYCCKTY